MSALSAKVCNHVLDRKLRDRLIARFEYSAPSFRPNPNDDYDEELSRQDNLTPATLKTGF